MKKISRRSFLAVAGALSAAGLLSACGAASSTASSAAASVASSAAASSEAASSSAASTASSAAADASDPYVFLADKTIGVQLGTTGDLYISGDIEDGALGSASISEYSKGADAVQDLLNGKVDAVVIDDQVAQKFAEANDGKLAILETAYATEDYAICFKKGSELVASFNEAIAALKDQGILANILAKYIDGEEGAVGYEPTQEYDYANGKLVMATNAEFEPYEFKASNEIVGIDAEFGKAICDYLNYDMEIEDIAFDSIIPEVNSGKADFGMAGMTVTEDRLKNVDFTDSYCTGVQAIIYKL